MINDKIETRSCNLCGERNQLRLILKRYHYNIIRCDICGLVYTNEIPSTEELTKIYSENFFNKGEKFSSGHDKPAFINAKHHLDRVLSLPNIKKNKWLDVGCATGDFLIASNDFVSEMQGVELSEYAASQVTLRSSCAVTIGGFTEVELQREQYDVLTMWDFLEHVIDPTSALKKANEVMKPGGYLVISTGDIEALIAKITAHYWHLMIPPRHLYFFSPKTIKQLLSKMGFELISITYPGRFVPLDFVLWKMVDQVFPSISTNILSFVEKIQLGRIILDINLHDIMEVYARKI